jgi:hypothetical protein
VFLLAAPSLACAWGDKGHKTVATIALNYLTDNARADIQDLLGPDQQQFVEAAPWADQVRFSRPQTAPWHFVDIPYDGVAYDPTRDCANNDCVVAKFKEFSDVLANKDLLRPVRVEALKWVIHFVGDVHQPLHAADDNDRGGNEVWVTLDGKTDKLHSVWDTALVNELGDTPADIATSLITEITDDNIRDWGNAAPADWANESFTVAHDFIYARSRGKNTDPDRSSRLVYWRCYTDRQRAPAKGRYPARAAAESGFPVDGGQTWTEAIAPRPFISSIFPSPSRLRSIVARY